MQLSLPDGMWALDAAETQWPEGWRQLQVFLPFHIWGLENVPARYADADRIAGITEFGTTGLAGGPWVGNGTNNYLRIDSASGFAHYPQRSVGAHPTSTLFAFTFRMQDSGTSLVNIFSTGSSPTDSSPGVIIRRQSGSSNLHVFNGASYFDTGYVLDAEWHTMAYSIYRDDTNWALTERRVYIDGYPLYSYTRTVAIADRYSYWASAFGDNYSAVDIGCVALWLDFYAIDDGLNAAPGTYPDAHAKCFSLDPFALIRPSEDDPPVFAFGAGTNSPVLSVADATHAHAADNVTLSQVHDVAIADATHAHAADNTTVDVAEITLLTSDAAHAHVVDVATLSQVHDLTVADATHAHAADNATLDVSAILVTADAAHAHTADALSLTQVHDLLVADAAHAHTADALTLSQVHDLVVADATHAHAADNVLLDVSSQLVLADATHAHAVDNATLVSQDALSVADATHAHTADVTSFVQLHVLVVADALHAHSAANTVVTDETVPTGAAEADRVIILGDTDAITIRLDDSVNVR